MGKLASPDLETASSAIHGRAFGGQQAVADATVTVYVAGTSGYGTGATALASTTTDSAGNFNFASNAYTCPAENAPMYLVVTGGNPGSGTNDSLALAAVLGACSSAKSAMVDVNEVTTAGTVLAMGQFMGRTLGTSGTAYEIGGTCSGCATGTYNRGLANAMTYTYPQLVDNVTGSAVATHVTGSVTVTTEAAKIYTMANVLATCVNSTGATSSSDTITSCGELFADVNATGASPQASDTLQAALEMVLYPYYNVSTVSALPPPSAPFSGLSATPNDWTVAISYATTSLGLGIAQNTSSNLDIDAQGRVWFPSNMTGANGLAYFNPASTSFSGAYGTIQPIPPYQFEATELHYPQYVVIDQRTPSYTWGTDIASNLVEAIDVEDSGQENIQAYTPTQFDTGGPLTVDNSGTVILAGGADLYEAAGGAITQINGTSYVASGVPNGISIRSGTDATDGYHYAADTSSACNLEFVGPNNEGVSTGDSTCVTGGILEVFSGGGGDFGSIATTSTGDICSYNLMLPGASNCTAYSSLNNPKGLVEDGAATVWVASAGDGSVAEFNATSGSHYPLQIGTAYLHGAAYGGTLTKPYGIGVDGSGNIWLTNANCVATTSTRCNPTGLTVTEIVGVAAPTITPRSLQNVGTSPLVGSMPSN